MPGRMRLSETGEISGVQNYWLRCVAERASKLGSRNRLKKASFEGSAVLAMTHWQQVLACRCPELNPMWDPRSGLGQMGAFS